MQRLFLINITLGIISCVAISACSKKDLSVQSGELQISINNELYTFIGSINSEAKPIVEGFTPSEYLELQDSSLTDFELTDVTDESISDDIGKGTRYIITGTNEEAGIIKQLIIKTYDEFPNFITTQVNYINKSGKDLPIRSWVNNNYNILSQKDDPLFWAFQGSSSGARADWIKPLTPGYYQENYMGMNNSDYGGGIPVTDIWRPDMGLIVGHTALTPQLISLPTELKKNESKASLSVQKKFKDPVNLKAGDTLKTLETFVALHKGDYYNGLQQYSLFMQAKGIVMPPPEPEAFEPIWCAWGYERNFTLDEILGTLPKVKELGISWAVLDDGFQQAEGDWHTNRDKFPGGDEQMKEFVNTIQEHGLKAKIWWAPLAADPDSELLAKNPDMQLVQEDGTPQFITWWDAHYLSPAHPATIEHTKEVVNLFMNDWGFQGLKMDGQHMNAIAPDYNPNNGFDDPIKAVEKLPEFFKLIYEEARKINPSAVVENCPCGTCMSFYNMPYMNQAVSSDPLSSWQVRLKGKTYKALIPATAYYGDHVELSDGGDDFASSFGIGAVLGTKFTWPKDNPTASGNFVLTPEKEEKWKKWFSLYNEKMLSKEKYLGELYDIGFDKPETHVISKGDTLHYAFYADSWEGEIELRGLSDKTYHVRDYINEKELGQIQGSSPTIDVNFKDFLFIEVYPLP